MVFLDYFYGKEMGKGRGLCFVWMEEGYGLFEEEV